MKSVLSIATWSLGAQTRYRGSIRGNGKIILVSNASRPALVTNHLLFNGHKAFSPGVKLSWREAHCLPASRAEVKNQWSCTSIPPYAFICRRTQLYLYLPSNLVSWASFPAIKLANTRTITVSCLHKLYDSFTRFENRIRLTHIVQHYHNFRSSKMLLRTPTV